MSVRLDHVVRVENAHAHLLSVETQVRGRAGGPLVLAMPVWTPGSYLVREYSRHVERLWAHADGNPVSIEKVRKNAWRLVPVSGDFVVRYSVYCNDLSVRTNHVDTSHVYFNGASTFLYVEGETDLGGTVTVEVPEGWQVATALREEPGAQAGHRQFAYGSYDELVDSPVEIGTFRLAEFDAAGKPHRLAVWVSGGGNIESGEVRLVPDVRKIVEAEAAMYGGVPDEPYLFILHLAAGARGGLEHRASSSLLASAHAFESENGYAELLSLFAHEYLHRWHVKRARPGALVPYRYEQECYTRLLWLFEGATTYYDWHVLRRCDLVTPAKYLEHLADTIQRVEDTPGRFVQSLEQASFDAWIKLYRPDENSFNSTVSYYVKGELVCALLDVAIRHRSAGRASLDDLMRAVLRAGGDGTDGLAEGSIDVLAHDATGVDIHDLLDLWVRGHEDLDLASALRPVGLVLKRSRRDTTPSASLGLRVRTGAGFPTVAGVTRGSAAELAGIESGDLLVAVGGWSVEEGKLVERLRGRAPGDAVRITVVRRDRLVELEAILEPTLPDQLAIVRDPEATAEALELGRAWLGGELPETAKP